jgi:arsenate reductase
VWSAGTEARGVHPLAVKAMAELGIDISEQRSKTISEVPHDPDYVITLCDEAAEACSFFPGETKSLHWGLTDPSATQGDEEAGLLVFREVRDQIARNLQEFWRTELNES